MECCAPPWPAAHFVPQAARRPPDTGSTPHLFRLLCDIPCARNQQSAARREFLASCLRPERDRERHFAGWDPYCRAAPVQVHRHTADSPGQLLPPAAIAGEPADKDGDPRTRGRDYRTDWTPHAAAGRQNRPATCLPVCAVFPWTKALLVRIECGLVPRAVHCSSAKYFPLAWPQSPPDCRNPFSASQPPSAARDQCYPCEHSPRSGLQAHRVSERRCRPCPRIFPAL